MVARSTGMTQKRLPERIQTAPTTPCTTDSQNPCLLLTQVTIYIAHPSIGEMHHAGVTVVHDLEISDDEQDPDDLEDEQKTILSEENYHEAVQDTPHGNTKELVRHMAQAKANAKACRDERMNG